MPARPPLQVEVVTKIPVRNGLNLADAGVSSALSVPKTAASRVAAEVVTDVPGILRNITPLSFGQKAAQIGKTAAQIGSKTLGIGLGVAGDLLGDLLFPDPVGQGSDMVGGVKIGSQPKPAPMTAPATTTQPIAKPQVTTAPFKPAAPVVAPVAGSQKPKPQTQTQTKTSPQKPKPQTQTQPLPSPATTQPQSAPAQTRPKPQLISTITPEPRSALETPLPSRPKPVTTTSPYPLNIVDITSYGGVNLAYPIAQKLTELSEEITSILEPNLEQIQIELQDLPQKFEDILKKARIQTTINLPAKIDLTSQIPFQLDLSKQVPVAVDVTSQLPLKIDLSKQVPVAVSLTKKVPVAVDLTKEIPVAVDLSTKLNPKAKNPDLEKLKKCCEDIQKKLKEPAKQFEGSGEFICKQGTLPGTLPYSYQGEGLEGIHQLIEIILDANKSILQKVCEIEYPLLKGSGTYLCGSSPAVNYNYSGVGFFGIQNQIDQLFKLEKVTLGEVCSANTLSQLTGSQPNIAGKIEYFGCDNSTQAILYSGKGVEGISSQMNALTALVKEVLKISCENSCVPLMPDARFEEFKVTRQLVITWGTEYPTQSGSLWHTSIPQPKSGLDWCKDFEELSLTKGEICGRLYWQNSAMYTGSYFESENEAWRVIRQLASLSDALPQRNALGDIQPRMTTGGSVKRKPANRLLRAVRAVVVEIGTDGEPENLICFIPPQGGCP